MSIKTMNYNKITTIFFIAGIIVMSSLYTAIPLTAEFAKDFKIPQSIATLNGVAFSVIFSKLFVLWDYFRKIWENSHHIIWDMWACNDLYGYGFCTFFRDTGRFKSDTRYICLPFHQYLSHT